MVLGSFAEAWREQKADESEEIGGRHGEHPLAVPSPCGGETGAWGEDDAPVLAKTEHEVEILAADQRAEPARLVVRVPRDQESLVPVGKLEEA